MKYSLIRYGLETKQLLDKKTIGQLERRMSKTARNFFDEHKFVAIDFEETIITITKHGFVAREYDRPCPLPDKEMVEIVTALAWKSNHALKCYISAWYCLHEIGGLQ